MSFRTSAKVSHMWLRESLRTFCSQPFFEGAQRACGLPHKARRHESLLTCDLALTCGSMAAGHGDPARPPKWQKAKLDRLTTRTSHRILTVVVPRATRVPCVSRGVFIAFLSQSRRGSALIQTKAYLRKSRPRET